MYVTKKKGMLLQKQFFPIELALLSKALSNGSEKLAFKGVGGYGWEYEIRFLYAFSICP